MFVSASAWAGTPGSVVQANLTVATSIGGQTLSGLVLPPDASQSATEPAGDHGELARPAAALFYRAEADTDRFWVTAATPSTVMSSAAAALPSGARPSSSGAVGNANLDGFRSWLLPPVDPRHLGQRLLVMQAVVLANGQTGVRADVWVQYQVPRPTEQRVPEHVRVLDLTVTQAGKVLARRQVTTLETIQRIAEAIENLPFESVPRDLAFPIMCPPQSPDVPQDSFRFQASPTGKALATVSLPADSPDVASPCTGASLWIRGHRQPALADGGALLKTASKILGTTA